MAVGLGKGVSVGMGGAGVAVAGSGVPVGSGAAVGSGAEAGEVQAASSKRYRQAMIRLENQFFITAPYSIENTIMKMTGLMVTVWGSNYNGF